MRELEFNRRVACESRSSPGILGTSRRRSALIGYLCAFFRRLHRLCHLSARIFRSPAAWYLPSSVHSGKLCLVNNFPPLPFLRIGLIKRQSDISQAHELSCLSITSFETILLQRSVFSPVSCCFPTTFDVCAEEYYSLANAGPMR